jgi:hypothetical protein
MQKIRAEGVLDLAAPNNDSNCVRLCYRKNQKKSSDKSKKNCILAKSTALMLDDATQYLYAHFKRAATWRITERDDSRIIKRPSTMRGNKVYAYYQSLRCEAIQHALDDVIVFSDKVTNSVFITLTSQYNPQSKASINQSWQNMRKALPVFADKMRRLNAGYVMTVEAHRMGGCHAHAQLILRKSVKMYEDREEVWRCADETLRRKIKQKWADSLGVPVERAHCDIEAVHDSNTAQYLLKELKKVDSCEQAVKNLRGNAYDGELSDRQLRQKIKDEKKVLAFYFAIKNKMRMLRVSRNFAKAAIAETEAEKHEADLIELCNKSDVPRREILLTRSAIFKLFQNKNFMPYTGIVESKDELDVYKELFDNKGFPKIKYYILFTEGFIV